MEASEERAAVGDGWSRGATVRVSWGSNFHDLSMTMTLSEGREEGGSVAFVLLVLFLTGRLHPIRHPSELCALFVVAGPRKKNPE